MQKQILEHVLNNGLKDNCYNNMDTHRCINDIVREYLNIDYNYEYIILFDNIRDCSKFPEVLRFAVFDWQNIRILVYHEPKVVIYKLDNYEDALKLIAKGETGFLNQGLKISNESEYKRIFLFKDLGKHKIKSLTQGDTTIKPGDFLSTCWGYDQTNVETFIIKKIIGKNYFIIMEVAQEQGEPTNSPTYDNVKIASTIKKIDIHIKAYISNDVYMSVCEHGYKRGLSLTDMNQEHYKTSPGFGH